MNYRHYYRLIITGLLLAFVIAAGCSGTPQTELSGVDNSVKGKRLAKVLDEDQLVTHAAGNAAVGLAGDQATPSVAFYDDPSDATAKGVYLSVYTSTNGNTTEIHGAVCKGVDTIGQGQPNNTTTLSCGDDAVISTTPLQPRQSQPKVAFDLNSKKFMVVWVHSSGSPTGTFSQIYGSAITVNPAAKTFTSTAPTSVTPDPDGIYYTYQSDPDIVFNPTLGKFVVSWLDTSAADGNRLINSASIMPSWKASDTISVTGFGNISAISIKSNSTGATLTDGVDYTVSGSGTAAVTVTIIGLPFGTLGASPTSVVGQPTSLYVEYADTATAARQNITVTGTWRTGDTIKYTDLGIAKEAASNITKLFIAAGTPVTSFNDDGNATTPTLTLNAGSNAVGTSSSITVYTYFNNLVVDTVKGNKCSNFIGPVIAVPQNMVGGSLIRSTEIDINFMKYPLSTSNVSAITTSGYSDNGSFDANFTLQLSESNPKIIVNPATSQYDIGWSGSASSFVMSVSYAQVGSSTFCTYGPPAYTITDNDGGKSKIKVRRNSGFGSFVTYTFGTGNASGLTSAVDPSTNRVLLAWEDDQQILGSLFDMSSFNPYKSSIPISVIQAGVLSSPRTSPKAAFDNVNQRFLVIWEDARNQSANLSNIDIYGQFVDPQGNLSGGNTIVTVARGNQLAPAMAFGNSTFNKFLVVFKDGRDPANSDIYGQMLEFSTSPQLALYLKDSTTGVITPLLNGALDFGTIPVGDVIDKIVIIRNDGNTNLTILTNGINDPSTPYSYLTPKPVTINPGTQYEMVIRFAPFASGSYASPDPAKNFYMSINSDGGKAIVYFSGSGSSSGPLSINTSTFPDASPTTPATTYSFQLSGSGGVYPYTWDISGMPASFDKTTNFNAATGLITWSPLGTDVRTSPYNVVVTLTDNASPKVTTTRLILLKVGSISIKEPTGSQLASWGIGTVSNTGEVTGANYSIAGMQFKASTNNVLSSNYIWTVTKGALPTGIVFDATTKGLLSGIPTVSGTFTFTVRATDPSDSTLFAEKEYSLTINPQPVILTTSLPPGTLGGAYNFAITMTGGTAPFSWSISPGYSMPPGLVFSNGVISGTPTAAATYKISVTLTDATGAIAQFPVDATSGKNELTLQINAGLDITTPTTGANSPKMATASSYYSFAFSATGGTEPYTWDVVAGTLPPGLTLQPGSGGLSGTPDANAPGNYSFNLRVRDNSGTSVTKTYKIVVAPPLNIGTSTLQAWTLNAGSYSQQLAAVGGASPYSWSWQGSLVQIVSNGTTISQRSALPAGLVLNPSTGLITGTPTTVGTFEIDVTLTDGNAATITKKLILQINDQLKITTSSLASGIEGVLYVPQQITLTGGTSNYTWSYTGTLPSGLTFTSGVISGVPSANSAGIYSISVTVKDAANASFTQVLSISIVKAQSSSLKIDSATIGDMKTGVPVSATLLASGGTTPYVWSVYKGSLAGLSLNANGGTIAGTPAQAGNYDVIIRVTDSSGQYIDKAFSFVVRDPLLITSSILKSWDQNLIGYVDTLTATGGRIPYVWDIIDGTGAAIVAGVSGVAVPGATGLFLNQATGIISGTPTVVPGTYSFTVRVSDAATPKEATIKQLSITISSAMTVSTTPSVMYQDTAIANFTLNAVGGTLPKIWSSSPMPAGLSLSPQTGIISGTPTAAGTYSVIFTVTDQTGRTANLTQTLTVNSPVSISTTALPNWTAGKTYNLTMAAAGGVPVAAPAPAHYNWSITAGNGAGTFSPIPGLTLNATTGAITGTPVQGTYNFTITATDANGVTANKAYTVVISPAMAIQTAAALTDGFTGSLYSQALTLFGGTTPYSWSIYADPAIPAQSLPAGLNIDAVSGVISGIPVTAGTYSFTVLVQDANAISVNKAVTIKINSPPEISSTTLPDGEISQEYNVNMTTTAGTGTAPFTWTLSAGTLPPGMTFDTVTGNISGIPTVVGKYDLVFQVSDQYQQVSTPKALSITVVNSLLQFKEAGSIISSLAYGNVLKGTARSKLINLYNGSSQSRTITAVTSSSQYFGVSSLLNLTIAAGQSAPATLSFNPVASQPYTATLSLTDSTGSITTLDLSGTGTSAVVTLPAGSTSTVTSNPMLTTSPSLNNNPGVSVISATQMLISNVTGGFADVTVTYDTAIPIGAVFYKVINLVWTDITSSVTVSADRKSISYRILDNDARYDADLTTPNTIVDPIIVGTPSSSTSGSTNTPPAASGGGKGGGGCFIATAAYGSYLDPHVMVLRHFRDNVLLQSELGTAFVKVYYKHSPPVADFIARHDALRVMMRLALTPLIFAVKYPLVVTLLSVLAGAWFIRRRLVVKEQF